MKNTNKKLQYILSIFAFVCTIGAIAQDIKGTWKGELEVQGMKLEMSFNISDENGNYSSTFDVPQQGAVGIPLETTTFADNTLTIESAKFKLKYVGILDGENLNGTYSQMGQEYPFNLKKTVKTKPGDTSLPSSDEELNKIASLETSNYKYAVEDFFKTPDAYYFKLSPDGKYMSYLKRTDEGKSNLYIKNIESDKEVVIVEEKEDKLSGYFWANEDRILYSQDKGGNENYHLFGVNIDGSNNTELTPYKDVRVTLQASLKEDKEHVIVLMNKDNPQQEEPYKLNIISGDIQKLYTVKTGEAPIPSTGYKFDKDGNLRAISRIVNGVETTFEYKIDGEFKKLHTAPMGDAFSILSFNYNSTNPDEAYVATNLNSDKTEVQLFDLRKNEAIKTVYKHDVYDVASIRLSRKRNFELDYVIYNGEKYTIIPMSKTYKKIHKRLKKEFGDKSFYTVGKSDDESVFLIVTTSDKIVGEYYTYDIKKDEVKLLYKLLPKLEEKDMATVKPITFTSRDGITLHGYITLPKEAEQGKKVPMVVIPHGGPQGVRDSWSFLPENQLFASRGYATLQVNFRISGGYGKEFMKKGFKQIGRKVMDDIEDGIQYSLNQGWIDKGRIAIYGVSHGGYAVLRGLTKTPELYACGVDYVGVSNLNTFMNTIPAYWEKYRDFLYKAWYNPNNPEEKKIMDEISPALHVDKIEKPLFVIQGANDPRVNIDEADQIVKNLRARGISVPYMVKYNEGHGFHHEDNRIQLYKTVLGFFAEHLK